MTLKDDCVECVNFEFSADSLGLNYDEPNVFFQSQVCLLLMVVYLAAICVLKASLMEKKTVC